MTELSREARAALARGLELDGPSAERRARVKSRLVLALGSGAAVLGGSVAAAAEAASPFVAGAAAVTAKGLAVGSLLVWFGAGALAGAGVSGAVVAVRHVTPPATRSLEARPLAASRAERAPRAGVPAAPAPSSAPGAQPALTGPGVTSGSAPAAARSRGVPAMSALPPVAAPPAGTATVAGAPSVTGLPSAVTSSGLSEEAALLQRAERALAANEPGAALSALAEHERRFPAGVLREERQAAKVLALCELGRVAEARSLARVFLSAAPGSVLVPRLERSCVGPVVKAR
jgi:hypothetical protein